MMLGVKSLNANSHLLLDQKVHFQKRELRMLSLSSSYNITFKLSFIGALGIGYHI